MCQMLFWKLQIQKCIKKGDDLLHYFVRHKANTFILYCKQQETKQQERNIKTPRRMYNKVTELRHRP